MALLSFVKMSNTLLRLFDGLLISTEKLVLESLSGIMRALRILSYKILLFIYSVLIWLANDVFITVSNSKLMLEIVYDASGFDALMRVVKGFSVTLELGIFSVKREIRNLIHVNRDQGHFRDS